MKERRRIHKLVKKLRDPKMLTNLIKNLDKHRLTKDFVYSIQKMAGGDHPVDSIPHLSHLESIRFKRIKDSQRMYYSSKMKRFWHCWYKVGGGPPIHLLSGPRGTGENNYNPSSALINFAVPSQLTLHRLSKTSHTAIPPSIFHPILERISDSLDESPKGFILSFDGKSVGPGLKEECEGDVDLWNFEAKPNLNDEKERLTNEHKFVSDIRSKLKDDDFSNLKTDLYILIKMVTMWIKDVRDVIKQCRRTELKYQKADQQNPKYRHKHKYTIQHAKFENAVAESRVANQV